jgi:hypothetical protein
MGGHVALIGEMRNVYTILIGKPVGKVPLGKTLCSFKVNIKTGLRKRGFVGLYWTYALQDRDRWRAVASPVLNLGFHERRRIS